MTTRRPSPALSNDTSLVLAACALAAPVAGAADAPFVVLPAGQFRGIDGRPAECAAWVCDDRNGPALAALLNSRQRDLMVDYDHQSLYVQQNGQKAVAAGWLPAGAFEYRPAVGLVNTAPHWTAAAAQHLSEKEYRYTSPVLLYDAAGRVRDVISVALTNTPNLDQLASQPLAALAAQYGAVQSNPQHPEPIEDDPMDEVIEQLRWMIGLPITATKEEILAQLDKLRGQIADRVGTQVAENGQNLFDAVNAAGAWKAAANHQQSVDLTQYAPIAVVHELQAALAQQQQADQVEPLITAALADGRLRGEGMVAWARDLGQQKGAAELKGLLEGMPKVAALSQQQTRVVANSQQAAQPALDDITAQITAQFGNDPAAIAALM